MVCPLRFILVGISALLAVIVAWNIDWKQETPYDEPERPAEADEHTRAKVRRPHLTLG